MDAAEREAIYDAEIAPALAALAKRCQDVGMSFLAEVEWNAAEAEGGQTAAIAEGSSFAFRLVKLASDVRGNVDGMFIALKKHGVGNSMFLRMIDRQS